MEPLVVQSVALVQRFSPYQKLKIWLRLSERKCSNPQNLMPLFTQAPSQLGEQGKSTMNEVLSCIECSQQYSTDKVRYHCDCGGLLEVKREEAFWKSVGPELFDKRLTSRQAVDRSGVWRFREAVIGSIDDDDIVTHPEGGTRLYHRAAFSKFAGCLRAPHPSPRKKPG